MSFPTLRSSVSLALLQLSALLNPALGADAISFERGSTVYFTVGQTEQFVLTTEEGLSLQQAQFFLDEEPVHLDVEAPYTFNWMPDAARPRTLSVTAIEGGGNEVTAQCALKPLIFNAVNLLDDLSSAGTASEVIEFKGKLFVVGADKNLYSSETGLDWSLELTSFNGLLHEIHKTSSLLFVNNVYGVHYSSDGATWSFLPLAETKRINRTHAIDDVIFAETFDAPYRFVYSTDLLAWRDIPPLPGDASFLRIEGTYEGRPLVFADVKELYRLNGDYEWEIVALPADSNINTLRGIHRDTSDGEFILYFEGKDVNGTPAYKTTDFLSWQPMSKPTGSRHLSRLFQYADLYLYEDDHQLFFVSTDGMESWTALPEYYRIRSVAKVFGKYWGTGGFVSEDGLAWSYSDITELQSMTSVLEFNDKLIGSSEYRALPPSSLFALEAEGAEAIHLGAERIGFVSGFARGDAGYLAIGEFGVARSDDTIDWQRFPSPSQLSGNLTYGNGIYVAAAQFGSSIDGGVGITADGETWEWIEGLTTNSTSARVVFLERAKRFAYPGGSNYVWLSPDGRTWAQAPIALSGMGFGSDIKLQGGLLWTSGTDGSNPYLAYSSDGIEWKRLPQSATAVSYFDGAFYVRRSEGSQPWFASADLESWTALPSELGLSELYPTGNAIIASSYKPGAGYYYSENGIDWSEIANPPLDGYLYETIDDEIYLLNHSIYHLFDPGKRRIDFAAPAYSKLPSMEIARNPRLDAVATSPDLKTWTTLEEGTLRGRAKIARQLSDGFLKLVPAGE